MNRTAKNVLCAFSIVVLTCLAIKTGFDVFEREDFEYIEQRDESFGGFGEDRGFTFDEEEDWFEHFQERDFFEDEKSSATEDESTTQNEDSAKNQSVKTKTRMDRGRIYPTRQRIMKHSIKGYAIIVLIEEIFAILLIALWLILSKGNKKTFAEVFAKKESNPTPTNLPDLPKQEVVKVQEEESVEKIQEQKEVKEIKTEPEKEQEEKTEE